MTTRSKVIAGVVAVVVLLGGGALALTVFKDQIGSRIPLIKELVEKESCPLNGAQPANKDVVGRPAVAVKVENATVAYPLSGLHKAELVYEEVVEGGVTRFMAIYHCNDSSKVGPVRSARVIDPALMLPITRILGFSGSNAPVRKALEADDLVLVEEDNAKGALRREPRDGLSSEHTLYANTEKLRSVGDNKFGDAPPQDLFNFDAGLEGATGKAKKIEINFSSLTKVRYVFDGGRYKRFQPVEQPFEIEGEGPLEVDNVLIEEHEVKLSKTIVDVQGNPSTEIADETGRGRALLFRDGSVIEGTWSRDKRTEVARFETKGGEEMKFKPGSIWVHLVPSKKGEVKGSFSFD